MRGGRFQQKSNEDANARNAEVLFETRTIADIREVESRTREDIEEKKEELRQLVGASYRDLIESADSILAMRRSCEAVVKNIAAMEDGFASLHRSLASAAVAPGATEARIGREKLFGLGSRVKYLVDTPEKIWGCLDEHMYLEGAERFMRAREVHTLLTAPSRGEQKELLASFPLLGHQWPLVQGFRDQISQKSRERLQEVDLSVGEYAVALSAAAIIDNLPSDKILTLFLDSRRAWLRAQLRMAAQSTAAPAVPLSPPQQGSSLGVPTVSGVLCRLISLLQMSLCHAGELFLEVSSGHMPLLFRTVLSAPPGSQLFGGIPNPEQEVELWKQHREHLETSVCPLEGRAVQEACQAWIKTCAQEIAEEGQTLLEPVRSARELAEAEATVRTEIANQNTFRSSMGWLASAYGAAPESNLWECICDLLLKGPLDLWNALFEGLFTRRAQRIVDSAFDALKTAGEVARCLDAVQPSASREGVAVNRRGEIEMEKVEGSGGLAWRVAAADDKDWFSAKNAFFSPEVTRLRDDVDNSLQEVLGDVVCLLRGPDGAPRTKVLGPYLQERCHSSISLIVRDLEQRLEALSSAMASSPPPDAAAAVVEKALLIGRFSAALGQYSVSLPVVLGPPSSWTQVSTSLPSNVSTSGVPPLPRKGSWIGTDAEVSPYDAPHRRLGRRSSSDYGDRGEGHSQKLRELQKELRRVSIAAHQVWVGWSTRQLAATFVENLRKDDSLATISPLKGWEETVLRQEEEGGQEVEMRMSLPAMPSPHTLAFLYAGCREIHRVGSHTLDKAVLRLFAWKLSEEVLSAYEEMTSDASVMDSRVSEKGLLQLLFDLRFLSEVLSGGVDITQQSLQALDDEDAASSAAGPVYSRLGVGTSAGAHKRPKAPKVEKGERARKLRFTAVENLLTSRLDPIDWATYEHYLWMNEQRYYQRCSVLLGSLIQLSRLHTDAAPTLHSAADANTLDMAPPYRRFVYLPISAPMLMPNGGSSAAQGSRKAVHLDTPDVNSWTATSNGEGGGFSFADAAGLASIGAAKPLFKSLMGQMESGAMKLGSIVTDGQVGRNISTLGDMLPSRATSLFSSLTSGAAKVDG